MAGLPWIKVWTAIGDHPKVQRLEKELGVRDALGVVVRLWCWTADYCPIGDIPASDIDAATKAARGEACRKPPQAMVDALVTAGLLDPTPTGFRVHDWHDMQTVHVDAEEKRKASAAERQARYRQRHGNASRNASRNAEGVTEREREKETEREATTHTQGDAPREGGAADRQAIEAAHGQKPHPLTDDLVRGLRARSIEPCYPKNGTRGAVEAAIAKVGVPVAVERVAAAWDTSQPWLTFYLQVISGQPPTQKNKPAANVNAPAPIGTNWGGPPPF